MTSFDKKIIIEFYAETGEDEDLVIDPYQDITFNAGFGMKTTLQSVVDAGLLSAPEVRLTLENSKNLKGIKKLQFLLIFIPKGYQNKLTNYEKSCCSQILFKIEFFFEVQLIMYEMQNYTVEIKKNWLYQKNVSRHHDPSYLEVTN